MWRGFQEWTLFCGDHSTCVSSGALQSIFLSISFVWVGGSFAVGLGLVLDFGIFGGLVSLAGGFVVYVFVLGCWFLVGCVFYLFVLLCGLVFWGVGGTGSGKQSLKLT